MNRLRNVYGFFLRTVAFFCAIMLLIFKSIHWFVSLLPSPNAHSILARFRFALFVKTLEVLSKLQQDKLLIEILLKAIKQYPRWQTSKPFGSTQTKKPRFLLDPSLKQKVFDEAYTLLTQTGTSPFICFGLLLGHVRENGFMEHDLDFDFGFFYEAGLVEKIYDLLNTSAYQIKIYEPSPWPCRIVVLHKSSGLSLEVVFFKKSQNDFLTYTRYRTHLLIRKRKPFELVEAHFANRTVLMPAFPEIFLSENYGNWKEKSEYHHWIVTSPLTDFREAILQPLLLSAIFHNLYQNKIISAKQLIDKWNEVRSEEKIFLNS